MNPQPSSHMIDNWATELCKHLPFSRLPPAALRQLLVAAHERYAPPDAAILRSGDVPTVLYLLRRGRVSGERQAPSAEVTRFELDAGAMWPVAALLAQRPSSTAYTALEDCFYLCIPWPVVQAVMAQQPVFSAFLIERARSFFQAAAQQLRQDLQDQYQQRSDLEMRLADLPSKAVFMLDQQTPLRTVLQGMQQRKVGSVLLTDAQGDVAGILTRNDVLDRIALPQMPMDFPVAQVMTAPVRVIAPEKTVGEAALLMAQLGIRHLPVLDQGRVVNLVSERDLFALQRQSIRQVSTQIHLAQDLASLRQAAVAIRDFAAHLLAQGSAPQTLTRLISDLNDKLCTNIIRMQLQAHGLQERDMCWIALGSEGRGEQTIATDQDNALIFASDRPEQDRARWMAFALDVNNMLDACGFPLCKGGIMASRPECCQTLEEWRAQFLRWIEQGSPSDLLKSAVFFDLRGLAGQAPWAEALRSAVLIRVPERPLFLQLWVNNHLNSGVALSWHGGLATTEVDGHEVIDIKLSGTAIVVDAARILALSQGIAATATHERLLQASERMGIAQTEYRSWVTAFDFLQTLRLKRQILSPGDHANANAVRLEDLNLLDRQMLKSSFQAIRSLQQRLKLDFVR
jgi:CBS domain-containing protein